MPAVEIRPVVAGDIPAILKLEHSTQSNYVWQMEQSMDEGQTSITFREVRLPRQVKVAYPRSTESLESEWKNRSAVLVACLEGEVVGYTDMIVQEIISNLWVADLVVGAAHRRKGIGTALMLAAQEWGSHRRLRRITLEMQSKNIPAIRFARKLGLEFSGYNDHYYANHDIALFWSAFLR